MTTWMGLEHTMLSEINQTQKDKYYVVSLTYGIENSQTHNSRERGDCQGLGKRNGEVMAKVYTV